MGVDEGGLQVVDIEVIILPTVHVTGSAYGVCNSHYLTFMTA